VAIDSSGVGLVFIFGKIVRIYGKDGVFLTELSAQNNPIIDILIDENYFICYDSQELRSYD
jgi:hypothetical protein